MEEGRILTETWKTDGKGQLIAKLSIFGTRVTKCGFNAASYISILGQEFTV